MPAPKRAMEHGAEVKLPGIEIRISKHIVRVLAAGLVAAAIAIGNLYAKVSDLQRQVTECKTTLKLHNLVAADERRDNGK